MKVLARKSFSLLKNKTKLFKLNIEGFLNQSAKNLE